MAEEDLKPPAATDVTNLDGSSGTNGQFLQTDGSSLNFAAVDAGMTETERATMLEMIVDIDENRFANSLPVQDYDATFFDTFVDQSKIASSSGANITTGQNGSVSLTQGVPVEDDVESGSSQLNWEGNANTSIDSNSEVNGTYSVNVTANNASNNSQEDLDSPIDSDGEKFRMSVKIDNQAGDYVRIEPRSSGNRVLSLYFKSNGDITCPDFSTVIGSWTAGTQYDIVITFDFTNDQFDLSINGTNEVTDGAFSNSSSNMDRLNTTVDAAGSSNPVNLYFDDYTYTGNGYNSSGSITSTTHDAQDSTGSTFTPSKVQIEQTLTDSLASGEDVTYDLTDGNGNTATITQSEVGTAVDVSGTFTTGSNIDITVNFSGDGSSTPELEDYGVGYV